MGNRQPLMAAKACPGTQEEGRGPVVLCFQRWLRLIWAAMQTRIKFNNRHVIIFKGKSRKGAHDM